MSALKKYITVARINFRYTTWIAYLVAGICLLAMLIDLILDRLLVVVGDTSISMYNMLYLVCLLAPVLIASVNYRKLMNIGVKKKTYLGGCAVNYIVFAAAVSLLCVLLSYLVDRPLTAGGSTIYGLIEVFGWNSSPLAAFLSQFAFLLLTEVVLHTLTFMQTRWYGWAADALIVTIISVFTPIPALRTAEVFFFDMTIFSAPVVQVPLCLALAALVYATNLFYLKNRS